MIPNIPPATRETVMTKLFTILQGLAPTPFITVSRKLRLWDEVPPELQPALFMTEHTERNVMQHRGLPDNRRWEIQLFIYATIQDDQVGSIVLNNLIDALEAIMRPDVSTNVFTIGGTVYRAWTEGEIRKDPGDLDGQALARVPLSISAP